MLYVGIIMVNTKLTINGVDKIFQGSRYEMKNYSLLPPVILAQIKLKSTDGPS